MQSLESIGRATSIVVLPTTDILSDFMATMLRIDYVAYDIQHVASYTLSAASMRYKVDQWIDPPPLIFDHHYLLENYLLDQFYGNNTDKQSAIRHAVYSLTDGIYSLLKHTMSPTKQHEIYLRQMVDLDMVINVY